MNSSWVTCVRLVFFSFFLEKMGKNEKSSKIALAKFFQNSIIGVVPERDGRKAEMKRNQRELNEVLEQFEGIGDVLSDGP